MARSEAKTVTEYLLELPENKREQIQKVRSVILENLPDGYVEVMNWGMITYEIPLSIFPDTYNKQPLMYAALAAQKNHNSVYLMALYVNDDWIERLKQWYDERNIKLNMGKSCIRFTKLEKLPLDFIGEVIAAYSVEDFIKFFEKAQDGNQKKCKEK